MKKKVHGGGKINQKNCLFQEKKNKKKRSVASKKPCKHANGHRPIEPNGGKLTKRTREIKKDGEGREK
jgi:hypothetical protein